MNKHHKRPLAKCYSCKHYNTDRKIGYDLFGFYVETEDKAYCKIKHLFFTDFHECDKYECDDVVKQNLDLIIAEEEKGSLILNQELVSTSKDNTIIASNYNNNSKEEEKKKTYSIENINGLIFYIVLIIATIFVALIIIKKVSS